MALDIIRSQPPFDAVLLDWNMPVMDGITLLKTLKDELLEHRPVVIMCTTENDMQHISAAIESGASEYIMKPFDSEIIQSKLQQVGLI